MIACVASVPVRSECNRRAKESFGPREKWEGSKKVEGRGWGRGKKGKFSSFPYPTSFLPPFCSRPIFRASRMRKTNARGPNFVLFVRERLLCRLDFWRISCKTHVTLTVFSPTSFPGSVDVLSPPKSIDGPLANCWGLGSSLRWPSTPSHSTREGRGG